MKYFIQFSTVNEKQGVGLRLVLLSLINMFVGIHTTNGDHLNIGIGCGPMEMSLTLHRWNRWLP
jgi:hypothetical protein